MTCQMIGSLVRVIDEDGAIGIGGQGTVVGERTGGDAGGWYMQPSSRGVEEGLSIRLTKRGGGVGLEKSQWQDMINERRYMCQPD